MKTSEKSADKSEESRKITGFWSSIANSIKNAMDINNSNGHMKKTEKKWRQVDEKEVKRVNALFGMGLSIAQIAKVTGRSTLTIKLISISKDLGHYKINMHEFWKQHRGGKVQQPKDTFITPEDEEKYKNRTGFVYKTNADRIQNLIETNERMETIMTGLIEKLDRFLAVFEK